MASCMCRPFCQDPQPGLTLFQPSAREAPSDGPPLGALLTSVPDRLLLFNAPRCQVLVNVGVLDHAFVGKKMDEVNLSAQDACPYAL